MIRPLIHPTVRRAIELLVHRVASLTLPLAAGIGVARALGRDEFGAFAYLVAVVSAAQLLVEFGLDKYLPREFAIAPDLGHTFRRWFGFKLWIAGGLYGLLLLSTLIDTPLRGLRIAALLYGATVFTHAYASTVRSFLVATERTTRIAVASATSSLVGVAGVGVILQTQWRSVAAVSACLLAAALVDLSMLAGDSAHRHWRKPVTPDFRQIGEVWEFAAVAALTVIYGRIAVVVLEAVHGEAVVGTFSAAASFYTAISLLPVMTALAAYPDFARAAQRRDRRMFWSGLRNHLVGSVLVVLAVAATAAYVAPQLLGLVYGNAAERSSASFRILMFGSAFVAANAVLLMALYALHRQRLVLKLAILTASCAVGLNVSLIPSGAAEGGAWATTLAEAVTCCVFSIALVSAASNDLKRTGVHRDAYPQIPGRGTP